MLYEIGIDDGIEEEGIDGIVHVIVHIIVRPSRPILELEGIITSPSLFELVGRHGTLLKVVMLGDLWKNLTAADEAREAELNDLRQM